MILTCFINTSNMFIFSSTGNALLDFAHVSFSEFQMILSSLKYDA